MKYALTLIVAACLLTGMVMAETSAPTDVPNIKNTTPAPTGGENTTPGQQPPAGGENTTGNENPGGQQDPNGQPAPGEEEQNPLGGFMPIILIGGMFVLMIFMSSRGRKKEQKRRQQMLAEMKKGDRVVSIGGIIGTAIDVRDDEVLVQIAEGTRMKFLRSAIARVGENAKAEAEADNENKQ